MPRRRDADEAAADAAEMGCDGDGFVPDWIQGPSPDPDHDEPDDEDPDDDDPSDDDRSAGDRECKDSLISRHPNGVAVHTKKAPRRVDDAPPRPRSQASAGTREPNAPYMERDDIGKIAIYQGNWGGRSSDAKTRHHIFTDIIVKNPGTIITAQEVDFEFIELLRHPQTRSDWRPKQEWMTKQDKQAFDMAGWHVAQGDESPESTSLTGTCIIAAKNTLATEVHLLEWALIQDAPYWKNRARARTSGRSRRWP